MKASPERLASILRAQLGLDKPVLKQLWMFVQQVFTFNCRVELKRGKPFISSIFATRLLGHAHHHDGAHPDPLRWCWPSARIWLWLMCAAA